MTRGDLSTTGILNAAVPHLRRVAAPAAGILLLTALPVRLLQIHLVDLLIRLKGDAPHYGNLLTAFSALTIAAFVFSLYGRAVFIHACHNPPDSWRSLLRVPTKSFLAYVYVALMIEMALVLFWATVVAIPLAIMLAGVAAAGSTDTPQVGLLGPLRGLAPYFRQGRVLAGLMLVFTIAYVAVLINLAFLARVLVWAGGTVPGFDSVAWAAALRQSPRFVLSLLAVSATAVEPFFLAAMHVYADRVRSRESGEDLIRRFRALTAMKAVTAAAVIFVLISGVALAQERTIPAVEYVRQLRVVHRALAAGRHADAVARADDLQSVRWVSTPRLRFEPDRALLRDVRESASRSQRDLVLMDRVQATIDALGHGDIQSPARPPDQKLLQRIRADEQVGELMRGGELKELPQTTPTIAEELRRIFEHVIQWLAAKLERLFDWIGRLWPKARDEDEERRAFLGVPIVVWVVTLLIVATMVLLAAYVLRRSRRRAAPAQSEPMAGSERDADPLSRESTEWERYADELAASGRLREAIRAWYHAVLVTLYRAGVLHYRKGITNWEYVSALSPAHGWRPQFISITRKFDREWYGRIDTTPDVLESCVADARAILDAVREGGR